MPDVDMVRSILIFPANVSRFVEKAPASGADAICLDLEDSVPPSEKETARRASREAIAAMPPGGPLVFVRVNGARTGLLEEDLIATVQPGLDGVVLTKMETAEDILRADHYLDILERERGITPGTVRLIALIETARGLMCSYQICASSARLAGAIFGAEDFATDMGIERSAEGQEVLWARSQLAIACRAAGVAAIDTPTLDYSDAVALESGMRQGRSLGYTGKLCIHPAQVPVANRVFSPSPAEVAAARELVAAFEREALAKGRASIDIGGKMVDTPMYERAKRILKRAEPLD
jgi:citrate lyase subunit beta/citryl-CoA lyase